MFLNLLASRWYSPSSVLLPAACRSRLSACPSVCHALRDVLSWCSMSCSVANCSSVYSMLTHAPRVVCWTDQPLFFTSPSCSGGQPEYGCERASRVLFWLRVAIPPKLLEQSSTLLLTCSHRCASHVPRGQWALLDADMLALIDRSACLVEACTCGRHTKSSTHGPLTVSFVSPTMRSFAPRSLAPALAVGLDLLLDDLLLSLHSFTTHLNDSLTRSCLGASHRHSGLRVFRLQPVDQGCDRSSHLAFDHRLCMFTCLSTN